MQLASRKVNFNNLGILIIFAICFQRIQADPPPDQVPYNYYFANGTLVWLSSEDATFFTIGGEFPAVTISYKPNMDLNDYHILIRGVIANTSDPSAVKPTDNLYGDNLCRTVGVDGRHDTYIGYIVTKQILRFLPPDCKTSESVLGPYLVPYGFHNVLSYDRNNIPCNKTWFYHYYISYQHKYGYESFPLTAIYQIDMAPGLYHCNPEIYAEYN